ncbi:uncharacterized protein TM35_000011210 [Trypanosoma theileri]|uniref:Uncharacterized protein n=1 Tax=Trypanosoma theileri TaxID=67003 RepID=A0A1X0P8H4_9TRYP|nr:uncharacterized protein TM35_000011210 [Trypanosoma theileri]ORC93244.1 hypothetical protein TM35_000011210 [Trypanosoma theileri]
MVVVECADLTVELQRLRLFVTDALEMNINQCSRNIENPLLFLEAAQTYSTILSKCEAPLSTIPDGYNTTLYEAARVGVLLLSATDDAKDNNVIETIPTKSACDYVIEGIERFSLLLPSGRLVEAEIHEEIMTMVSLLGYTATQWHLQERAMTSSVSPVIHGGDNISSPSHRKRVRIDNYLRCAQTLMERGSFSCRDAEQLLSSSSSSYGGTLQRFLLHTLQEEFTLMRHLASGAHTALVSDGMDDIGTTEVNDKSCNCLSSNGFYYYAPLPSLWNNNTVRHGRSASTASAFSTGCTTPRSRHGGEEHGWQLRSSGSKRNIALNRNKCKNGTSVEWAMTVLGLLGTGIISLQDPYDNTSDFVDFIGDLVSVCAIVVLPFLTEQLESLELQQQETSYLSNLQETQNILLHAADDMVKYRKYVNVVKNFLSHWDPSFVRPHIPPAVPVDGSLPPPLELVVKEKDKETQTEKEEECKKKEVVATSEEVVTTVKETKQDDELQWESVAPSLAAHLASNTDSNGTMSWSQVVSLATETKHFRETEVEKMWGNWVRMRGETIALANEVVRMQKRRDVLLEVRSLLLPPSGSTEVNLQQKWEQQLNQYERDLQEALVKSKQK